jgi:hypothetical protein
MKKMLGETIEVNSFIDVLKIINKKHEKYDILIDYHDRNKWIKSKHITLTFIQPENNPFIFEHRGNRRGKERYYGCYILNKDKSIAYIYDIHGRYDYCPRKYNYIEGGINNGTHSLALLNIFISNIDVIKSLNRDCEILLDNGKNKEDIDFPYILEEFKDEKRKMVSMIPIRKHNHKLWPYKKGTRVCDYDLVLKDRTDGGIDLYDTSGTLHYVCNIGKRYEYYLPNQFDKHLSSANDENDDILVEFIPDKEKKWIIMFTCIDSQNNPYLIQKRADGGVDLISKKDNTLKYICNIGRRFYYVPSGERWHGL